MKVTENPSHLSEIRRSSVFGPIYSGQRYIMHNNNLVNVTRGLLERVFRVRKNGVLSVPPLPGKGAWSRLLSAEFNALTSGRKLRPLSLRDTVPLWKGSKLKTYTRAYETLLVNPLTRRDGNLSTFVKVEKINSNKQDPVPRVIQPRHPRYNLHLARFLKPNEKEFYRRIDRMWDVDGKGDKTVFKGLDASQVAHHMLLKASRYSSPVFIGLDASRFDQHVSVDALRWEHQVYNHCFEYGRHELAKLLSWQVNNVGYARVRDGNVKYAIDGCRMSGDMNTSLGNCMLMSCMVHAYMRHKNIPSSLANNGDDCVLIFERKHLSSISDLHSWFLNMGFNIVQEEPLYDIRRVPFCQTHVLISPGHNIAVRDPKVCLSKDLHSVFRFTSPGQYLQWLSSVGLCGRMSNSGVPILESFYSAFPNEQITDKSIMLEVEREIEYCMVGGQRVDRISDEMRHSFWIAFGIPPDCQIALEELLAGVEYTDKLGVVSRLPLVDNLTRLI